MKRKKIQGDGLRLATLLYGPPKKEQQELPFDQQPEPQKKEKKS